MIKGIEYVKNKKTSKKLLILYRESEWEREDFKS